MRNQNKEPIQYSDSYSDVYTHTPGDPISGQPTSKKSAKNCKKGSMQQKKNNSRVNG